MIISNQVIAVIIGIILTTISYMLALAFQPQNPTAIEILAVATSYASTYLCVVQSRINYIWGAVSVALYTILFYNQSLYASTILNAYLFPTLVWGWFRWRADSNTRPVTMVGLRWWPVYLGFAGIVWYVLSTVVSSMGAAQSQLDSMILCASILAQFLLDQKKIENWVVWFIVNVVAIVTYFNQGLYLVGIQYILFLLNVFLGFYAWYKTFNMEVVNEAV